MAELRLEGVSRHFGAHVALSDIDLTVPQGKFVSLLGPSGCGKSTTLAIIAGLDRPTTGTVRIGPLTAADPERGIFVPPEDRGLGLVLQSYALWPHMTVRQNVELPLKIRRIDRTKRAARVDEYLALVEMSPYAARYPHELSGGQQQRVALARTLVYEPVVLLLDEPLSNVDAKLRERARGWFRQMQRKFNLTTVFVTHDQSEALAMSDLIAVMSHGRIVQFGTPAEVYGKPASVFVADFVGSSNIIKGRLCRMLDDGFAEVTIGGHVVAARIAGHHAAGTPVHVAVRPERIGVEVAPQAGRNGLAARITDVDFLGAHCLYHADIDGQSVRFDWPNSSLRGTLMLGFDKMECVAFADASEMPPEGPAMPPGQPWSNGQ